MILPSQRFLQNAIRSPCATFFDTGNLTRTLGAGKGIRRHSFRSYVAMLFAFELIAAFASADPLLKSLVFQTNLCLLQHITSNNSNDGMLGTDCHVELYAGRTEER